MRLTHSYPLTASPLFKIQNKRKLADLLCVELSELKKLPSKVSYRKFTITKAGKQRDIYDPIPELKKVQKRLNVFLSRIETPDWLKSGKKGISYVDNGKSHIGSKHCLTVDIKGFYENCKKEFIFKTFHRKFKMAEDVAWLLTDIVSFENKVPTGTPTSQVIAFWTYEPTFQRIKKLSETHSLLMTVYVDDIAFSSLSPLPTNFHQMVDRELQKVGLRVKTKKSKFFASNDHKIVTGNAITPDSHLRVPNKLRHKIITLISKRKISNLSLDEKISLRGMLSSARQIEPYFFNQVYLSVSKLLVDLPPFYWRVKKGGLRRRFVTAGNLTSTLSS